VAIAHDDDPVGHRHRLDLVMGDVDGRGAEALVQLADLGAHLDAQLGVEVRERLVEQEHLRVAHDGTPHRDALALAARKLARIARKIGLKPEDGGGLGHARLDIGLGHPLHPQGKTHVRRDRLVRIEGVVLKDHGDVALGRRQVVDDAPADPDRAARDALEARDHAQERRLSASRRAHEHDELAVGDIDIHPVHDGDRPVGLAQRADFYLGHVALPNAQLVPTTDRTQARGCPPPCHANMLGA
jgi:hypothetical protein